MKTRLPAWASTTLFVAGIYNLTWGAWVVLFPSAAFDWLNVDRPKYLELWQCIGMIVGCYGIAYLIAATDPARYWPITLVGLLGKVAGPIGFVQALWNGVFPLSFGWLIIFNDLIWWIPFTWILWLVYRTYRSKSDQITRLDWNQVADRSRTASGKSLGRLLQSDRTLVIFLRHAGCTFCREMLSDLSAVYANLKQSDVKVVLVHMSDVNEMQQIMVRYDVSEAEQVSDPDCALYQAFGLKKGSPRQLFGLEVWQRGWDAGVSQRHGVGMLDGDGFQMPGVFVFHKGELAHEFIHRHAGDRPDYLKLIQDAGLKS